MVFAIIDQEGVLTFEDVDPGRHEGLDYLQAKVGGYVESPGILNDPLRALTLWCNEEGKINGRSGPNPVATRLIGYEGLDVIFGPIVISGPVGPNGETTGLGTAEIMVLAAEWAKANRPVPVA